MDNHQISLAVGELLGMSRAVSWKPDGQWLIVGLGGRVGRKNITSGRKKKRKNKNNKKSKKGRQEEEEQNYDGHFMIFEVKQELYESSFSNYEMLTPYLDKPQSLHGDRPNNWICDVKFSPSKCRCWCVARFLSVLSVVDSSFSFLQTVNMSHFVPTTAACICIPPQI